MKKHKKLTVILLASILNAVAASAVIQIVLYVLFDSWEPSSIGEGLFVVLGVYSTFLIAYVTVSFLAGMKYGWQHTVVYLAALVAFYVSSQSLHYDNYLLSIAIITLAVAIQNVCVFVITGLDRLPIVIRIFAVVAFVAVYNITFSNVSARIIATNTLSENVAEIHSEIYIPSNDEFAYDSFQYFTNTDDPYWSIKLVNDLGVNLYEYDDDFDPPSNCQVRVDAYEKAVKCERVAKTENGRAVWKRTRLLQESAYTQDRVKNTDYYARVGDSVIHFNEGISGITDDGAVRFIESLEKASLDELLATDAESARQFRYQLSEN